MCEVMSGMSEASAATKCKRAERNEAKKQVHLKGVSQVVRKKYLCPVANGSTKFYYPCLCGGNSTVVFRSAWEHKLSCETYDF